MLFKLIGAIFVIGSCSVSGYYFSMADKFRIEELRDMKRAMTILKGEIDFSSSPLSEAFREAGQRVGGTTSELMEEFSECLAKRKGESASQMWSETLEKKRKNSYFGKEDIDAFLSFGRALGYLDREQQCSQIDLVVSYLNQTEETLLEKSAKTAKLYRSMGVLIGTLVTLVLL